MAKIKILTDSCGDLGKEMRQKYDIDYCRMNTQYEGKETPASLDWEYYTPKSLYDIMRDGNRVFTTQVPTEEFVNVFGKYAKEGYDIIYVGCSLKQSGSVNIAKTVAADIMSQNPGIKIFCIDSKHASTGEGMLAIRAAEYRDQGLDADTIAARVEEDIKYCHEFCTVHTLDCLKRAGRVKASSAFFGNLLGVKPIIIADAEGDQTAIKKVKGRKAALDEIVQLLSEAIIDSEEQTIYISHADCLDEAEYVKKQIEEKIPCKAIQIEYMGPIIGSSIGPSGMAVFGWGKEITFRSGDKNEQ
ncbi:MAG: DegV family protein [Clostridiales bacterium]|nr:DegV family protein [Clostridiales bacterium]